MSALGRILNLRSLKCAGTQHDSAQFTGGVHVFLTCELFLDAECRDFGDESLVAASQWVREVEGLAVSLDLGLPVPRHRHHR